MHVRYRDNSGGVGGRLLALEGKALGLPVCIAEEEWGGKMILPLHDRAVLLAVWISLFSSLGVDKN